MPSGDKSIRIIKRGQRESLKERDIPESRVKTQNQTRREILKTVTSWVEELREAKKK
jgi:hypothetical protein